MARPEIIKDRLEELLSGKLSLSSGAHPTREAGMCAMEAAAYVAGEPHSDHPKCVCPVITQTLIRANDRMRDD